MLVIISDLHLTDGSSGETIPERAFRIFRARLRDLAYDASWRADGRYKPIEQLDVLLLGDVLDVIRSVKWGKFTENAVRPWSDRRDPEQRAKFAAKVKQITDGILANNAGSLEVLESLTEEGCVTVPAEKGGLPDPDAGWEPSAEGRVPVVVKLHYMVGNHDWFFHLAGAPFTKLRRSIVSRMGLTNDPAKPFPHDPEECPVISGLLARHGVLARHGDIFDDFNFEKRRDASSLGDAMVIDLLNRFPAVVEEELSGRLADVDPRVAAGLKEIDNVRPLLLVPAWVDGLLTRTCRNRTQVGKVKALWNDLVDEFFAIPFVKERDSILDPWDKVDKLQAALRLSQGLSFDYISRFLSWVDRSGLKKAESYYRDALGETRFKNRQARFVVYGHTHRHEVVPLDVSWADTELRQMYLNSGTWRRVHQLAKLNVKENEFIGYNVMTYLAFFTDGERGGRPFEAWSGTLGV